MDGMPTETRPRETRPSLRVLVQPRDDGFFVQCVDYDIVALGDTVEDAIQAFIRRFMGHFAVAQQFGVEPLSDVPPASREVQDAWRQAFFRQEPVRCFDIPSFAVVEKGQALPPHFFARLEASIALTPPGDTAHAAMG